MDLILENYGSAGVLQKARLLQAAGSQAGGLEGVLSCAGPTCPPQPTSQ